MRLRVYTDTSVIGGLFDNEFTKGSTLLFNEFKQEKKDLVISDLTLQELEGAPERIRSALDMINRDRIEFIKLNNESLSLADEYLSSGILGPGSMADAQHIAMATVYNVDVLVSWNFKHIVNFNRIRSYNSVNLKKGYGLIEIRTPLEVLDEGI